MISLFRKFLESRLSIWIILLFGLVLIFYLYDPTLQTDPYSWLRTAENLFGSGETGTQHRNILFSYLLSIPYFLNINSVYFGIFVSGIALLISTYLIYRILEAYNKPAALYVSFIFLISYPTLRYGTQVFTDIPTLLFILLTIYLISQVLKDCKAILIPSIYLSASISFAFRYASVFYIPAFIYFMFLTYKHYKYHILGILLAIIPFIPQFIYNVMYLDHFYSLSYAYAHPTLGFNYFFKELSGGYKYQIFKYIREMFFDFRGILILFLPFIIVGLYQSFRMLHRKFAIFLIIFFISYLVFLSFYYSYSNRYAIPILLPAYIWLGLGINYGYKLVSGKNIHRILFIIYLAGAGYSNFEASFQLVQSSRAVHVIREKVFKEVNEIINDEDAIVTTEIILPYRFIEKKFIQTYELTEETISSVLEVCSKDLYIIKSDNRLTSEGAGGKYGIEFLPGYNYEKIASYRSERVFELLFYRTLRFLGKNQILPEEEWSIYKLVK
jgi:hypothetical protein